MCLPMEPEPCVFMHYSLEKMDACSPHLISMNIVLLVIVALSRRVEEVQTLSTDSVIQHLSQMRLSLH